MDKKKYKSRVNFTEDQQRIILDNYQKMSAGNIINLLQETDADQTFNEQSIYAFLRRVKREAEKSYQLLLKTNATEAAENLKSQISQIIPDKRHSNSNAIHQFLHNIIESTGVTP